MRGCKGFSFYDPQNRCALWVDIQYDHIPTNNDGFFKYDGTENWNLYHFVITNINPQSGWTCYSKGSIFLWVLSPIP